LFAKLRCSLAPAQKNFGTTALPDAFVNGGIIQDETFFTSSNV
jgi:hypothetical protein